MSKVLSPSRPYLLRAFYEWLLDNDLTPHLVVEAEMPGVQVPRQFVEDGQIVLNIAPHAVGNLQMGNEEVTFNARFGGQPHALRVPMYAVAAIYARENGAGTVFQPEAAYEQVDTAPNEADAPVTDEPVAERPKGRPTLKVIK
ncbi:ClpXP protease specificity-enhancing factor [Ferrimonas balearica]|uniref:ClpXP protease specificity-enhancing factor n=1 Tax=Ferrimonas balearica TaxID=44012 RepID=UPI001C97FDA3|nr:ClpXP protease specificity-enhancing factor [Ferrimonas balearica]MBY6095677.1 ClpXP protease specificity-enhancing factor [Ferrimonas balearica]MBY6225294.1 ClpXP protease specificity-enhancing factor [Ferrimonas balearica]